MWTRNKWIILFLLIIASALIVWQVLPQRINTQNFSFRPEDSNDTLPDCIRSSGITEIQWELSYPASLAMKQSDRILLTMYPATSPGDFQDHLSACDVILATRFEGDNTIIEPGDTLFFGYNRSVLQRVNWDVTAISGDINGKIWIYAITDTGSTNEVKTALFVIPIFIRLKSILGIDPQLFRIAVFMFSLLAAVITGLYGRSRKPE
jgi:hypothetical protein